MDDFWLLVARCFYLLLPAYFANMAPVIVKKVNFLAYPVDFNKKLNGKPILGKNKTFRGFFFGIIFAIIISYVQHFFYSAGMFQQVSFFDYSNWLIFGFHIGLGALLGDSVKSFFKRRLNIGPGEKFIPFDQTDFVIGALVFIMPLFKVTLWIFFASILISLALHIIVNHSAFYLGIRNEKW